MREFEKKAFRVITGPVFLTAIVLVGIYCVIGTMWINANV
jgi:hypothetical protein